MYSVQNVEGKGLGCIANSQIKRGTLIEKEEPALKLSTGELSTNNFKLYFGKAQAQAIIDNFNKMEKSCKEEYLNLSNKITLVDSDGFNPAEAICSKLDLVDINLETAVQVLQIYSTNAFDNGVFLKMSRFNHSCVANAEYFWNDKDNVREIRSISTIAKGEEITISYIGVELEDTNERRKKLFYYLFDCNCPGCNLSDEDMIEEKKLCKKMRALEEKLDSFYEQFENIENGLVCLKEMYKIAKTLKTLRISSILAKIVGPGFDVACQGYYFSKNKSKKEKFYADIQNFSSVALKLSTMLYGRENEITKEWQSVEKDPVKSFEKEFFAALKL